MIPTDTRPSQPTPVSASTPSPVSPVGSNIPFTIVSEGAPFSSPSQTALTMAVRGDDPARAVPANLPDDAKSALRRVFAQPDAALYLVLFAGMRGSAGYRVQIDSVVERGDQLVVTYQVQAPRDGAATVITYPFLIARLQTTAKASAVVFQAR